MTTTAPIGFADPWTSSARTGWNVVDASALTGDLALEADVVIVGSGAGGGAASLPQPASAARSSSTGVKSGSSPCPIGRTPPRMLVALNRFSPMMLRSTVRSTTVEAGTARATHGPNYDRLVATKRRYDPENRFRSRRSLVS